METPDIMASRLSSLRQSIDNIDAALVYMLAERFRCTDQVGLLKAKHQLPALDEAREQQQHLRLTTLAQSVDIDPVFVRSLMTFVMGEVVKRHKHVASTHQFRGGPVAPTNEEPA